TESLSLILHHADGSITRGESTPRAPGRAIRRVTIEPPGAEAPAAVIRAIERADLVVLSPGSLFTSTIASMLGARVPHALAEFRGPVIYVANVMTQPGETVGLTLSDHLRAIAEHVGPVVTDVLVHAERLSPSVLARYRAEGAEPVKLDSEQAERLGVRVHAARLLPDRIVAEARHDPDRLAAAVLQIAKRAGLAAPHRR
ncbi:MAG: YvcK family protein, partial [Solirubrobacterales bacterium]|nr:YvcK family protein [Solirubrobacterales bacterium]